MTWPLHVPPCVGVSSYSCSQLNLIALRRLTRAIIFYFSFLAKELWVSAPWVLQANLFFFLYLLLEKRLIPELNF